MQWSERGFSAVELLLAAAVAVSMAAVAVPVTGEALDEIRTGMAARYLQGRVMDARLHAIRRSACVGLRFEASGSDYQFSEYRDGNANGIRSADITARLDPEVSGRRALSDDFGGVRFGLRAGVPDVDGAVSVDEGDGVRVGSSRILSVGPDGTATSGTLYVRGRRAQYAVRVLGATGRARVLRFDRGSGRWMNR